MSAGTPGGSGVVGTQVHRSVEGDLAANRWMSQRRDEAERHAGRARPASDASGIDAERSGLSRDAIQKQMDLVQSGHRRIGGRR